MTWLTKLRIHLGYDEPPNVPPDAGVSEEAIQAYSNSRSALEAARKRQEEVREVTSSLAKLRARNHFGESIELAMMRREKRA